MPPSSSRRPRCRTSTTTTRSAVVPAWSGRSSRSLRATAARVVLQEDVFERDVLDGHVRHRPGQELAQHSPDVLAHAGGEPGVADTVHRHALLQAGHELVRDGFVARLQQRVPVDRVGNAGLTARVSEDIGGVLREFLARPVTDVTVEHVSLEDVFLQYYTGGGGAK